MDARGVSECICLLACGLRRVSEGAFGCLCVVAHRVCGVVRRCGRACMQVREASGGVALGLPGRGTWERDTGCIYHVRGAGNHQVLDARCTRLTTSSDKAARLPEHHDSLSNSFSALHVAGQGPSDIGSVRGGGRFSYVGGWFPSRRRRGNACSSMVHPPACPQSTVACVVAPRVLFREKGGG